MPNPVPIPVPLSTGGWHATECHPLPDGGMRCEPAVSDWMTGFALLVGIALLAGVLLVAWDVLRERAHARKLRATFDGWNKQRAQKGDSNG